MGRPEPSARCSTCRAMARPGACTTTAMPPAWTCWAAAILAPMPAARPAPRMRAGSASAATRKRHAGPWRAAGPGARLRHRPHAGRPGAVAGRDARTAGRGGTRRHAGAAHGFAEALVQMDGKPDAHRLEQTGAVLDADAALLDWITDSGVAAICADNYAVEAYPARTSGPGHSILPLHHHCLFAGRAAGRALVPEGSGRLAARAGPQPLPAHRAAAAAAGRGRLAGDADRHSLYHRPSNHRRRTSPHPPPRQRPSNHFNEHRARLQRYCRHLRRSPGCAGRRRSRARPADRPGRRRQPPSCARAPPRWPPGLQPGQRVAIWLPNCAAWVESFLACARLGAGAGGQHRFRALEVADILGRGKADWLIFWPGFKGIDFQGVLDDVPAEALARLRGVIAIDAPDAAAAGLTAPEASAATGDRHARPDTAAPTCAPAPTRRRPPRPTPACCASPRPAPLPGPSSCCTTSAPAGARRGGGARFAGRPPACWPARRSAALRLLHAGQRAGARRAGGLLPGVRRGGLGARDSRTRHHSYLRQQRGPDGIMRAAAPATWHRRGCSASPASPRRWTACWTWRGSRTCR